MCIFCDPPADRVWHEGELVYGLWDGFPVAEGHALLITRRHVASWFEATDKERHELTDATLLAREAIRARLGGGEPDGFNVGVNVASAGGQSVPHLHVHVIPRQAGDVENPRGGVRGVIPANQDYLDPHAGDPLAGAGIIRSAGIAPTLPKSPAAEPGLAGGPLDPLLPHLIGHFDRAVRADLAVAFVLPSGLDQLEESLRHFLVRGGHLRVLTGDYLDVTEPRALRRLLDLRDFARTMANEDEQEAAPTVELRVYVTARSSFHPKAYLFEFADGSGIAYVGSSNLTRPALNEGQEWNYRVILQVEREGHEAVAGRFEELFLDGHTHPLDADWIDAYELRRRPRGLPHPEPIEEEEEAPAPPPIPHELQVEALGALAATRADGERAALVVMATGLGKTWLAAFDAAQFGARRILFVAHREEILLQAQATFRRIRPEARLGLFIAAEREVEADVLFASIQSLGRARHLAGFSRRAFDYIVVDEFHHAAAATYRRLIDHFEPDFLLGLTATPERMDGGSLLALCGENLAYRCDLFEGIRRAPERLVPFHYFGVPDSVDYSNIPWRSGRFDKEALSARLAIDARAQNALEQWREKGGGRTLGFCVTVEHADFMAEFFRSHGLRAAALHSGRTSAPRSESLRQLAQGELDVLFAVDVLNEGVDVPGVDTVLMLRPTESSIVFLQQLGRGLRRAEGKDCLTVIDYIGNHKSFRLKPVTLLSLGPGLHALREALHACELRDFVSLGLPPGCEVTYALEAIEFMLGPSRPPVDPLVDWYRSFRDEQGRRPLAVEALHEGMNPGAARARRGSWLRLVGDEGGLSEREHELLDDGLAGQFLDELHVTKMNKSFKMVLLLALIRVDALPGELGLDQLVEEFSALARRHAALRDDVGEDLTRVPAMRTYLLRNPIEAWCKEQRGRTYFRLEGERLQSIFDVNTADRLSYIQLAREVIEWRLARYLVEKGQDRHVPAFRITCKVMRTTAGNTILKLPSRGHFEGIPEGWTAIRASGRELEANFVTEYVNVVRASGSEANVLSNLAGEWYGDWAGLPGTSQFVAFDRSDSGWTLAPLAPGQAVKASATTPVQASSGQRRIFNDEGSEVDARFMVERVDGEWTLVMESRGGTGGTDAARNTEYALGLRLLLERLAQRGGVIRDILLDTNQTRHLPVAERRLSLTYPIELSGVTDFEALRLRIAAAQLSNRTRRIRLFLQLSWSGASRELAAELGRASPAEPRGGS